MLIREVILENFMSYKYARIPLKPGVNVICGPNGAGKSSILLGISVAMGQSYTERSKKLSDLIRWGEDAARVTIILDNSKRNGRRPIPRVGKDYITLTRVIRDDGRYWFEVEGRASTKAEVRRLLARFGVNPENMLIIMHQGMVERFSALSPQERLQMVEEAVGLQEYRKRILSAQRKLSRVLSEEESVKKLLEDAKQTLDYWREQYEKLMEKRQLAMKRRHLEAELAWALIARREEEASRLRRLAEARMREAEELKAEISAAESRLKRLNQRLSELRSEWMNIIEEMLKLEYQRGRYELIITSVEHTGNSHKERGVSDLESTLRSIISKAASPETLEAAISGFKSELKNIRNKIRRVREEMEKVDSEIAAVQENIGELKAERAILRYREGEARRNAERLLKELGELERKLERAREEARAKGPRIPATRSPEQILEELRLTDVYLRALAGVSEDVEEMYRRYAKQYEELEEKARKVEENRREVMEEVRKRMSVWRSLMSQLLDDVDARYQAIISRLQATGHVKLINPDDIEEAGLEVYVGFKGAEPVPLNAYTQSGGERSAATIALLLALQQHVKSPFRAVDEYDVHLDPLNRQIIANQIVSSVKDSNTQYLVITPSRIAFPEEGVHIITVQSVGGESIIKIEKADNKN